MITKKIGNNYICYKRDFNIDEFIENQFLVLLKKIKTPFIVVLGGDGTMLSAIRKYYKKNISFLGINFGNVGFLLNEKKLLYNFSSFEQKKYPLLEVSYDFDGKKYNGVCFNEVNINACDAKVLELNLNIGGEKIDLRGDGVIVSTPAGSTAYNKSLYGPIISHDKKSFIMTPKAEINHKKSIIFDDSKKITIKNKKRLIPFKIYLDSKILGKKITKMGVRINILKSDYNISLLKLKKAKYT